MVATKEEPTDPREPTRYPSCSDSYTSFWAIMYNTADPVLDNGVELFFQPVFDDVEHRVAVHVLGTAPGDPLELFLRPLNAGGIGAFGDGPDVPVHHVRDFVRVFHHHLKGFFIPQIVELPEHFIGGAQIAAAGTPRL